MGPWVGRGRMWCDWDYYCVTRLQEYISSYLSLRVNHVGDKTRRDENNRYGQSCELPIDPASRLDGNMQAMFGTRDIIIMVHARLSADALARRALFGW